MARTTSSGTKISIGTTAASATGDTFKLIGEVTNIGEFGRVYEEITSKPLAERKTVRVKGNYDDGSVTLTLNRDMDDDGQTAANAALDKDDSYNFQVELNDKKTSSGHGTRFDFKAKVFSFTTKVDGSNSFVGASLKLGIDGDITTTDAA